MSDYAEHAQGCSHLNPKCCHFLLHAGRTHLAASDSHGRGATALVALSRHNLVVVGSKALQASVVVSLHCTCENNQSGPQPGYFLTYHSKVRPCRNVVLERNGSAGALALADGQVLVEGLGALDGRGVAANDLVDVVRRAVGRDCSLVGACRPGVVGAICINDIVFDERACGPAVEGEERVTARANGARVADGSVSRFKL